MKYLSLLLGTGLVLCACGQEKKLGFDDERITRHTTEVLKAQGMMVFMDNICEQGVSVPKIHSRYWIDEHLAQDVRRKGIEDAYRDFGYELLLQADEYAIGAYEHPDPKKEMERLEWSLKVAKWLRGKDGYENHRLGLRFENIATMFLLRLIVDMQTDERQLEKVISEFISLEESARTRAEILFEESDGVLDVRNMVKGGDPRYGPDFEPAWISYHRKVYKRYNMLVEYKMDYELLKGEPAKIKFFADDDDFYPHCSRYNWDQKEHKRVCVFGVSAMFLRPILGVFRFRKEMGDLPRMPGDKIDREAYRKFYLEKYPKWYKGMPDRAGAGMYVAAALGNTYCDPETERLIEYRKELAAGRDLSLSQRAREINQRNRDERNKKWLEEHGR